MVRWITRWKQTVLVAGLMVVTAGLTLWSNGWEEPGGSAQFDALVDFHRLVVHEGRIVTPEGALCRSHCASR
jgi:hypothetical protein